MNLSRVSNQSVSIERWLESWNIEYNFKWNQPYLSRVSKLSRGSNSLNSASGIKCHSLVKILSSSTKAKKIRKLVSLFIILLSEEDLNEYIYIWNTMLLSTIIFRLEVGRWDLFNIEKLDNGCGGTTKLFKLLQPPQSFCDAATERRRCVIEFI